MNRQVVIINKTAFQNNLKNSLYLQFASDCEKQVNQLQDFNAEENREKLTKYILDNTDTKSFNNINICLNNKCCFIEYLTIFHKTIPFFHLKPYQDNPHCIICELARQKKISYTDISISNGNTVKIKGKAIN